ncbi:MAG: LysM peptidoglycan-binding domain-containing protein, partial [Acidimicrobiales bacterium]
MRGALGELARGAAAAVVVFGAVPAVLIVLVGLPFPHRWGHAEVVSAHGLFDLLAVVAWVAWAACCWQLLCSVARLVRRRDATAPADARLPEWLATRIAAAVLAVVALGGGLSASSGAVARRAPAITSTVTSSAPVGTDVDLSAPGSASPPPGAASMDSPASVYTVAAGDTLWSIAEQRYGDGGDWTVIAQANLGRLMADGSRFVDPSLILPGWVLSLPTLGAGGPTGAGTSAVPGVATEAAATDPPVSAAPAPSAQPTRARPAAGAQRSAATHAGRAVTRPVAPGHRASKGSGHGGRGPSPVPLPELAALGLGTLAAAALARRARRARHLASLARREGEVPAAVPERAARAGTLLAPFLGAPVLDRLELADHHLGAGLAGTDPAARPSARLVLVGPAGVEVHLAAPVGWAPEGWTLADERTWLLPPAADTAALAEESAAHGPWLPLLVPAGDDERGAWLVPLAPGQVLPVIGPESGAMAAAMHEVARSWSWAEGLVVTDDPDEAERASGPGGTEGHLLFFGDPDLLSPAARDRAAVVTTRSVPASDLTVVIDARAASLHPLGLTLRPSLLRPAEQAAIAELVEPPVRPDGAASGDPHADGHRPPRPRSSPRALAARVEVTVDAGQFPLARVDEAVEAVEAVEASGADGGAGAEVRLLTALPRIDGLAAPLDPKRARRATEVVAYLALHQPDPVTSDRLRTRVLGSADADAASKTLFNTVGAARRAMGRGPDGQPLLPPASKSGHYRLSPLVTTDVARIEELVAEADAADDEEESIALLRAALGLVEGEPLAGALAGYGWWAAEGHERRIAATVVDAACRLARLAADHGYLDLARWGLERARLVEPYSELLSRAAMRVAAVAGDAERLRRVWGVCPRRVDEIDPRGRPAEATERH